MEAGLVAAALVLYNNSLNLWSPFRGGWYVPLNLTMTAALAVVSLVSLELSPSDILGPGPHAIPALIGALAGGILALPLLLLSSSRRAAHRLADLRLEGAGPGEVAFRMAVRVPLGTALTEEVAFRGVLLAAFLTNGVIPAAVLSSLAFGLWHIAPTIVGVRVNRPDRGPLSWASAAAGAVVLTLLAGIGLVWLRLVTDSLAAPVTLHAVLNSLGTLAGYRALRSTRDARPSE